MWTLGGVLLLWMGCEMIEDLNTLLLYFAGVALQCTSPTSSFFKATIVANVMLVSTIQRWKDAFANRVNQVTR
jgi:hypothetical protein